MWFSNPGKNRDRYWTFEEFEEQTVAVMDFFDVLYPNLQLMVEVDHSAGHGKFREGGLHVGNLNVKYRGKQMIVQDTTMTEGFV